MGSRLAVDPVSYESASFAFGTEIAGRVDRAALGLLDSLSGCADMAGGDPAGRTWGVAYDDAAALAVGASQDVVNGCYRLAALLQQTGFNYSRAEVSSTSGAVERLPDITAYASCSTQLGSPMSAAGGQLPEPAGWWLIEHAVGYVWPGGHQNRLRDAAAAWTAAAISIGDAALQVQDALECISAQISPEVDDALTACQAMDRHVWDLVAGYRNIAGACAEFAEHIDRAHAEIEHELVELIEWSAGIQAGGALFAVVSAGLSEVAGQGAQAGRIAATAAKVSDIIAGLVAMARGAAETLSAASARVLHVSRDLNPLLATRITVVTTERAAKLPALAKTTEQIAAGDLHAVVEVDKGPQMVVHSKQLGTKIGKHAADYGLDPKLPADRERMTRIITRVREQPNEVRQGPWHPHAGGGANYWFYRSGADVLVLAGDGNFVTILKGGQSNGWYLDATVR